MRAAGRTAAFSAADAADAAPDGADAAEAAPSRERGVTRTPRSSIEISTPSRSCPDFGRSILMTGSRPGGDGGEGAFGGSASPVTNSVTRQLNGGTSCRMAVVMRSRMASSAKRFQLMLTSQFA